MGKKTDKCTCINNEGAFSPYMFIVLKSFCTFLFTKNSSTLNFDKTTLRTPSTLNCDSQQPFFGPTQICLDPS